MTAPYTPVAARAAFNAAVADGDLLAAFKVFRELRQRRADNSRDGTAPLNAESGTPEYDPPRFSTWLDAALDVAERADREAPQDGPHAA